MRASATSKAASPASYYAPQAKPDAGKADEASPFALLVDSVAPKDPAKDSTKPPVKDTAASQDASQDTDAAQDDQAAVAPAPQSALTPKAGKTDKGKTDTTTKAGDDAAHNEQVAAGDVTVVPQQNMPAQPDQQLVLATPPACVPVQAPVVTDTDDGDDLSVGAATGQQNKTQANTAPATPAPFGQDIANATPDIKGATPSAPKSAPAANPPGRTAPKAQAPAQPKLAATPPAPSPQTGAGDESDDNAPVSSASNPPEQTSTAPANANPILTAQAAANAGSEADYADPNTPSSDTSKSHASATGVAHAAPRSAAARASLANPGQDKSDISDTAKGGSAKPHTLPTQSNSAVTAGTEKSDAPKSDDLNVAAAQPDAAPAPKPVPQPAPVPAAIDTIAAPQAPIPQTPAAPVTQHIQVSAHAAPDLPALAVEIAAKSQSGAKQFDIRLDPPELGRVEVRLSIDATGKASAHLSADQPQTLSLLQKDAPILTRALRDAGLDVSQNGLNFSLRQQGENSGGNAGTNGRRGSSRNFALSASLAIDATTGSAAYRGPANGRLDIRV